jgi:GMP synthase (glutamine-hydrolysing)
MSNPKAVNVIRHLAFEDLGSFASVLEAVGYQVNYYDAGIDDIAALDPLSDDLLIVLGGPISVNDTDMFDFIADEIALLRQRVAADKPTLGICLGAQLIARALDADVFSGPAREIGWYELALTEAGERSALRYLDGRHCSMLHWHGETFDLPEGAVLLASTQNYHNQAFSYGNKVLALQFHPEITQRGMERWFIGHIGEIMQTEGVSVNPLRDDTLAKANQLEVQGELFFNSWLNEVV